METINQWSKAYNSLNENQKKVAEHIYGPIMVISGPGTGKTQTLATRIGYLLKEGPTVSPGEILCLTFTEAGVTSMRKRIVDFIGIEGHRVGIATFHSFCNEIIQTRPDFFGLTDSFPVSQIEQTRVISQIIDELPIDHILKRVKGDVYFEVARLQNLFQTMKEESWFGDTVKTKCEEYLESLPLNEEYIYKRANSKTGVKVGDLKQSKIDAEKEKMDKLIAASELLPIYNQKLQEIKRYDFSDMIHWVIKALIQHPNFLRIYQERYQWFLVDEFQDTNYSQIQLLTVLLSAWDEPNVMIIGDDDQSVYEFNGARIKNIHEFNANYSPEVVHLNINYRSEPGIINHSTGLIRNNTIRLDHDKQLLPSKPPTSRPYCFEVGTTEEEDVLVAQMIMWMIEQGTPPEEIAVLYRKHRIADNLLKVLRRQGVNCHVKKRQDVLDNNMVNWLVLFFKLAKLKANNENSAGIEYRLLLLPFWGIDDESRMEYLSGKPMPYSVAQAHLKVMEAVLHLNAESLIVAVEHILSNTGIYSYMVANDPYGDNVIAIRTFWDFIYNESLKKYDFNYMDLLSVIENMESNSVELPENIYEYNQSGVTFTTCHGAKGLEWDCVFLIGANKSEWESSRGGNNKFSMPATLVPSVNEDAEESNRRLFYVGMTRARKELIITYANQKTDGRTMERSLFVDQTGIEVQKRPVEPEMVKAFMINTLGEQADVERKHKLTDFEEEFKLRYALSPTHLSAYDECGRQFYYERVVKVPALGSEAMSYGNAVHQSLETIIKRMKSEKKHIPASEITELFTHRMYQNKAGFSELQFKNRLAMGIKHINKYYEKLVTECKVQGEGIMETEYNVKRVLINDVPVKGVIDRIDNPGYIKVIDYKTGGLNSFMKNVKPGGHYFESGIMYALMIDALQFVDWRCEAVEFHLIDDDITIHQVIWNDEQEKELREKIVRVYNSIINFEFSHRCGKCFWCKNSL